MIACPKCQYQPRPEDSAYPGVCPACGVAYAKWLAQQEDTEAAEAAAAVPVLEEHQLQARLEAAAVLPESSWRRLYHYTCFMPSDRHESAFWGHLVLYAIFLVWGWRFIFHGVDWLFIGSSFLHAVNLPFHEYGHLMFSPFGTFWMFLGGSLFQILLPLFPLAYFMVWQRDNFAASLMLWWSGQNFIDVSPYIADAPLRALPLIGGNESRHDWWNLLAMSDAMELAPTLAGLCFLLGAAVILLANAWGGYLLWIEFRGRTTPEAHG